MIDIDGKKYYIDLDEMFKFSSVIEDGTGEQTIVREVFEREEEFDDEGEVIDSKEVRVERTVEKHSTKGKVIDSLKYETLRMMIEVVLTQRMGMTEEGTPSKTSRKLAEQDIDFQFAFNTLFKYKIIKSL